MRDYLRTIRAIGHANTGAMMHTWFAALFLLPLVGIESRAAESVSSLVWADLGHGLVEGREKSQVTLVFAQSKGCGPCRLMEKTVLPEVRSILAQLTLAKLDFTDRSTRLRIDELALSPFEWARKYGLDATPGFVLIDPQGRHILSRTGLLDAEAFGLFLAYGSTGAYLHGSFREYSRSMRQPGRVRVKETHSWKN
jgi:thioredoxin-related protein